jgi:hypothetical protein
MELTSTEEDSPEQKEIIESLDKFEGELERLETMTLLSGPHDSNNAILTIHTSRARRPVLNRPQ